VNKRRREGRGPVSRGVLDHFSVRHLDTWHSIQEQRERNRAMAKEMVARARALYNPLVEDDDDVVND
jgi:hypothetical protein